MSRLLFALMLLAGSAAGLPWLPAAEGRLEKVGLGWDPNGLNAPAGGDGQGGSTADVSPGWDPNG